MKSFLYRSTLFIKRILLLLFIYQLCRLLFFIVNYSYFTTSSVSEIVLAFFLGIRFDIVVAVVLNIPFILFHFLPFQAFSGRIWQRALKLYFFIINIPFLLLNCVDLEYFKFQGKRTTADLFQLFAMGDDMQNTIPRMALDFWYVILCFVVLSVIFVWGYNKIKVKPAPVNDQKLIQWILILPVILITGIGFRGGIQYKPLGILAAAKHTTPPLVPLVLNTPFTVIKTFGKVLIDEKNYLPESELTTYFDKVHSYKKHEPFHPRNVIIIILESFSSEYIGYLNNGKGYTPFLDSLSTHCISFNNAYANAKKSIDGIPAVVASMPTLMPASYITSPYNGNRLHSIAALLKQKGYSSGFFHGGNNGTMGFDNFASMTGFDAYYGRKEYPGKDYDGNWGIFDENFYAFFTDKMNKMPQPFVTTFFSLSSHHPYSLPEHLKNNFPKGSLPIHESIGYADYSLQQFFKKAQATSWYKNTLFVITSDHTGPSAIPYYQTKAGMFRTPILFYLPYADLKGTNTKTTQQTDIVPGILDLLNYDNSFIAFGNSPFDSTRNGFAVNYTGDSYQIIGEKQLIQFDGQEVIGYYDYKNDSLLTQNKIGKNSPPDSILLKSLQSILQQYNHSLIKNQLTTEATPN
ncbi:MAG: sulfatase-like hydrolase/transferase [Bacteroidetes bacterium]|nr:sulfatase-like hydrolase/transferase [Bacteroidota bacterium]